MPIERPNWGDGESRAVVPASNSALTPNIPADAAGDQLQVDHPSADLTPYNPGLEYAQHVEAGLSPVDAETLGSIVAGWPAEMREKLLHACANPPRDGDDGLDTWFAKLEKTFTLDEMVRYRADYKENPDLTWQVLEAMVR